MPYASAHLLINFAGGLPGGEQWSIGFRTIAFSVADAELQNYAEYCQGVFSSCWSQSASPKAFNSLQVTETSCTVRNIGTNGKTVTQAVAVPVSPVAGVASTPSMPDQSALVVSLLTARAGRSYRGRIYLPITAAGALTTSGRVSDDNLIRTSALNFTGALIVGLNGGAVLPTPAQGTKPTTMGRIAIQSTVTNAPAAPVISIKVGDVVDTQRRRRNKLVENYVSQNIPTPTS